MVPGIALIVPLYLVIKTLGLLDSLLALVMTYLTFTLPFTIWLLKSYFQGIPRELYEAALVDGCGRARMMLRVLLPAAAPGLVAAAMFTFMTAWNDYLFAVILTSSMAAKTVPVVVGGEAGDDDRDGLGSHAGGEDHGEQIVVPGGHEGEHRGRDEAGCGGGQQHTQHHAGSAAAIDEGGLVELARDPLEVALEQPDGERQREREVGHHQGQQAVEEAQGLDDEVERNDERDARHHAS